MEIESLRENEVVVRNCTVEHVIDLTKCINCENCTRACLSRHGVNRLNRREVKERSQVELVPFTCRQCFEQHCVKSCPVGAMRIDLATGIVSVSDKCVGCGQCARVCPHRAIRICQREKVVKFSEHQAKGKKGLLRLFAPKPEEKVSRSCAVKCDLCIGYKNFACAYECPTGALRVRMLERDGSYKVLSTDKEANAQAEEPGNQNSGTGEGEEKTVSQGNSQDKTVPAVDQNTCVKCGLCNKKCPAGAITMSPYPEFAGDKCVKCYACVKACPKKALSNGISGNKEEKPAATHAAASSVNPAATLRPQPAVAPAVAPVVAQAIGAQTPRVSGAVLGATLEINMVVDANMSEDHLRKLLRVMKEELKISK